MYGIKWLPVWGSLQSGTVIKDYKLYLAQEILINIPSNLMKSLGLPQSQEFCRKLSNFHTRDPTID